MAKIAGRRPKSKTLGKVTEIKSSKNAENIICGMYVSSQAVNYTSTAF